MKKVLILVIINFIIIQSFPNFDFNREIHWDWDQIDTSDISFPKNFLWGVATSEYQVSGGKNCPNANWVNFENKKSFFGKSYIENNDKSEKACDHWNLYKNDIQLMKQLGINAYRLSIEWSCIEPEKGKINIDAVKHYHDLLDELIANNILPMITLHHFTVPKWFEDEGAFEKEENVKYFVDFCTKMFNEFSSKVKYWVTINEPGVYVFQGYFRAVCPPQKKNIKLAGIVTKNLMLAHIECYRTMKQMENGQDAQIGIVHNIVQFEPYHPKNILEATITYYLNHIFHDVITNFLINKKLNFKVPVYANIKFDLEDSNEKILDFVGLNYYSHSLINIFSLKGFGFRKNEIPTDMPYGIYAEGFYRAIASISRLKVPIYITENGLADAQDNRRELFLKRYLYVLSKAIKDGFDVRGYFHWSLLDNFEWDYGFGKRFGLFEINYDTLERKEKKSAQYYKNVINKFYLDNFITNVGNLIKSNFNLSVN